MDRNNVIAMQGIQSLASARSQTRPPVSQREGDPFDVVAVDRREFIPVVLPCLQLVAPVGMSGEEQDLWFEAAFKALDGIPIGLLKRGAMHAMRVADHHSKIVPAINKEVGESWDRRRRNAAPLVHPALVDRSHKKSERQERPEVGALMTELLRKLEAKA